MTLPGPPSSSFSFSVSNFKFIISISATAILFISSLQSCSAGVSHGKLIGKLSQFHHGVSGEVYAIDGRTLYIKDLTYDGEGPAAYFYAGNSKEPIVNGFRVRDERGTFDLLRKYRKEDIILTLPEGKTLNNIRWFALWCDDFSVNFGDVRIPRGFDYPRPQKLGTLKGIHGVSSESVVVVDAQTFLIPSFSYDGEAPDAKFWVGSGPNPTPQGVKIPDENGKINPLRKYDHKTIVLTLPGDLTVHQLGHFGVWCEAFTVDFGHVKIPQNLNVPPSLKMLGVSPQSKLNCEVLQDDLAFEVRWAVAGDSIVVQLVAKLDDNQYMSFGLSNDVKKSLMVGGDVVVAWVDKQTLQGYAVDYFLDAKSQCSGQRGSCPDVRIQENTNSIRLLNAAMVNGYSIVTYQRPLKANDELDVPIMTNVSQAIIWAIGPLNERKEVSFHSDYLKTDQFIEFGRPARWNCPMPESQAENQGNEESDVSDSQETSITTRKPQRVPPPPAPASKKGAWQIPPIQCYEPEDGVFYAQMGPTGGKRGYPAITGHVGWGISWYINGLLIPEINVVRGKKYTFVVEGGSDPGTPARYHPFYITDDPIGGYQHKTTEEKANVKIFAGVDRVRGKIRPTGVGRLCNWVHDQSKPDAEEYNSFGGFQRTLTLECDHGEPGIVEWTPDENTPDTVYYHCYTHRHLGWKINVLDECNETVGSASELREVYASIDGDENADDLEGAGSVGVSNKVTPGPEYFENHHKEYIRNPSLIQTNKNRGNGVSTITQLIRQVNNNPAVHYDVSNYNQRLKQSQDNGADYFKENKLPQSTSSYHRNNNHHHHHHHSHAGIFVNNNSAKIHDQSSSSSSSSSSSVGKLNRKENENHQKLLNDMRNRGQNPNNGLKFTYGSRPSLNNEQQMMVIRRPASTQLNRRPAGSIIPLTIISNKNPLSMHQRQQLYQQRQHQFFVDMKKPVYRNTPQSSSSSSLLLSSNIYNQRNENLVKRLNELTKNDFNQNTIESKMSVQQQQQLLAPKQIAAKNTGFKPESVVVEGGFKPIIRITDVTADQAEDRRFQINEDEGPVSQDSREYRPLDSFEPMFIPSPPDAGNGSKKLKKKLQSQQTRRNPSKTRADDYDDMETAADVIDASYLPPSNFRSTTVLNKKPNIQEPLNSAAPGTLVTADGTQLLDENLARSIVITRNNDKIMPSRLSSDVLTRTPQFGKFRGELPPDIPANVRQLDTMPQLNEQQQFRATSNLSPGYFNRPVVRKNSPNTRLTLVQRSKRTPHHVPGHFGHDDDDDDDDHGRDDANIINNNNNNNNNNNTTSIVTDAKVTATNETANNDTGKSFDKHTNNVHDHDHHDHRHHDHSNSNDQHDHHFTAPSAGEFLMANIEYVVLTVILYFVI